MSRSKEEIGKEIKEMIEEIRCYVAMDGGDLDFIDFDLETGVVSIKLGGACVGCHLVDLHIMKVLKKYLPMKSKK